MRVGISGHQSRPGIDWIWVSRCLNDWLRSKPSSTVGYSCLAAGADQVFSQEVVKNGLQLTAVVPFDGYENTFSCGRDLAAYKELLARARVENLHLNDIPSQAAYMRASQHIVNSVEVMIFVWDGKPSEGFAGTADVVAYAVGREKRCIYLDPVAKAQKGDWS